MDVSLIYTYFPELTEIQKAQFAQLAPLYEQWNACINVISRKDMDGLYLHHVLHSLALATVPGNPFADGQKVLDVGTGGGFPGIPLAILFPEAHFTLCDSIGKKMKVVEAVATSLGLRNVTPVVGRVESLEGGPFDLVVSRAVTRFAQFIPWVWHKMTPQGRILYLKGGDVTDEINEASRLCHIPKGRFGVYSLDRTFPLADETFFSTKKICEIKQSLYLCAPSF